MLTPVHQSISRFRHPELDEGRAFAIESLHPPCRNREAVRGQVQEKQIPRQARDDYKVAPDDYKVGPDDQNVGPDDQNVGLVCLPEVAELGRVAKFNTPDLVLFDVPEDGIPQSRKH